MKDFFRSAMKIATAIFLAFVALSVLGWGAWTFNETRTREAAKQYEVLREWSEDLRSNLGMQLRAKTKVVNGRLYISANFEGHPAFLSHPMLAAKNQAGRFILRFVDADGFKVYEIATTVSEWSSVVDGSGQKVGLSKQFDEYLSIEDYQRFARLDVQWNLETEIPDPVVMPSVSDRGVLDHCAPKLARAERLRRLAQHGTVRETGVGSYTAGGKSLTVFEDGIVIYCQ